MRTVRSVTPTATGRTVLEAWARAGGVRSAALLLAALLALPSALGASLSGTVVDPEGRPVAGATVTVDDRVRTWTLVTDGDGAFRLDDGRAGQISLHVTPPAGTPRRLASVPHDAYVTLDEDLPAVVRVQVPYLVTWTGVIRDASGAPVAGAVLRAVVKAGEDAVATSAEDGAFAFDVRSDSLTVLAAPPATHAYPSLATEVCASPCDLGVTGALRRDVSLEPGARLSGRVTDALGTAAGGARVELASEQGTATRANAHAAEADADGRFALVVPPGRYALVAAPPAWHALEPYAAPVRIACPSACVALDAGADVTRDLSLSRGGRVAVEPTNAQEVVVAFAPPNASGFGAGRWDAATVLEAGAHAAAVGPSEPGGALSWLRFPCRRGDDCVRIEPASDTVWRPTLPPGGVLHVEVEGDEATRAGRGVAIVGPQESAAAVTTSWGEASFVLPPGEYALLLHTGPGATLAADGTCLDACVTVRAGDVQAVRVRPRDGAPVIVEDDVAAERAPVVSLFGDAGAFTLARFDMGGGFAFVPRGTYRVGGAVANGSAVDVALPWTCAPCVEAGVESPAIVAASFARAEVASTATLGAFPEARGAWSTMRAFALADDPKRPTLVVFGDGWMRPDLHVQLDGAETEVLRSANVLFARSAAPLSRGDHVWTVRAGSVGDELTATLPFATAGGDVGVRVGDGADAATPLPAVLALAAFAIAAVGRRTRSR